MNKKQIRIAADVGGTFTDVVLDCNGALTTAKVPTDIADPEQGILAGVRVVLEKSGVDAVDVDTFIHGTTLATNALIERKGARVALITTEGFRDSLEIGYENRYDQYDLQIEKPTPLIPRYLRFVVPERVNVRGEVLRALDSDAVAALAPKLTDEGVESVAVGLLHSYANPNHELAVRDILIAQGCTAEISLSSQVCPEVREYERFMTTACNAYVQPIMARYLRALEGELRENGFRCPLFLMTSGGGMTTLESAIRFPIRLVESGPSGGAVLASHIAAQANEDRVLSFDMGGTTAKICLIDDYTPQTARDFEIARAARFQKGSGMPVRIPVVEMIEIGAGGGSIAHVDSLGRLTIGPQSAGSFPGPACYQKGGDRAAVTDADLLIGKIDPNDFAEGKMQLSASASEAAIKRNVAEKLSVSREEAAIGISEMVEENMANAARIHSVEHGSDLTRYSMIAFGGAGPLHAARLAQKLNIKRVIVPKDSSVGSAVGFLWAPMAYEVVRSRYMTLANFDAEDANNVFEQLRSEAFGVISSGAPDTQIQQTRTAFMRYVGQGHEIEVTLPVRDFTCEDAVLIQSEYEKQYSQLYGRTIPERDIEILSWALVASTTRNPATAKPQSVDFRKIESNNHRDVLIDVETARSQVPVRVPVFARDSLQIGDAFDGPAMVAEAQTTTFVTSEYSAHIDAQCNLVLQQRGFSNG
ncbi:MAG: hydantoinase/oxoprolinase family protein [Pseudomonadota bacterium]